MNIYPSHCSVSGWNAIANNAVAQATLTADLKVKYLVVGAGYAGLAAARRLAELFPNDKIALVDALAPGQNSSGRNSGFMIDLPYAKIDARATQQQAQWQTQLLGGGLGLLQDIVKRHDLSCGWQQDIGHYKAATTAFGASELQTLEKTLQANQVPYRTLTPGQAQAELGSSSYTRVIWLKSCSLVQPAELVHGLIQTLPENVQVFFNTSVSHISATSPYTVVTNNCQITADAVVLCVNVSLPQFGYAQYRQLTVHTYAGLTRELTPQEAAAFGQATDWGLTPVERLAATSRKVAGNRYMIRGGFSYKNELPHQQVHDILAGLLQARYPDMDGNLLEHTWGGAVSMTRNGDPYFKQLGKQLYALSGCNASGILKMTMLGQLLVDSMVDLPSELLSLTRKFSQPNFIPPDPIRRIAFNVSLRKMQKQMNHNLRA